MGRQTGKIRRFLSRLFKERQIYHRSDGVVHFISMSSKTQIALAIVAVGALLWVAYASVNVVFKEQIIVAKERDIRIMETTLSKRLIDAQKAYDDVNLLNHVIEKEFDSAMSDIWARHQILKNTVARKAEIDSTLELLADGLAEAGGPRGQKPSNSNRLMIDAEPGEPTPRQSRVSLLRRQADAEAIAGERSELEDSPAGGAMESMEEAAAKLYNEQFLLLAALEETATRRIDHLETIIEATGVSLDSLVAPAKVTNTPLAQGGVFIDAAMMDNASPEFFQRFNRAAEAVDTLDTLKAIVAQIPLSSPLTVSRRFTSGFGLRRDPLTGKLASHHGIDFAAAWASPITATAPGVINFAGTRAGWGRMVEINHGNGFVTRYAHLNRITVKKGQRVELHDKIGELGSSGRSTGPHVHYEILFKGKPLNPSRFIEAGRYVFES